MYNEAVPVVNVAGDNNGYGGFGEWIYAIIILAMLGFGGYGGFGGFGGYGGFGGFGGIGFNGALTRAELYDGFALQNIDSAVRGVQQGICDSTYALNNTLMSGFHGVDRSLCDVSHQISDCCCTTQRAIDGVNYNMATQFCDLKTTMCNNTRDIIDSQNSGTRAILDFLTNEKIDSLRAENQALRFSASQDRQNALLTTAMTAQTNALVDRIAPYPIPSFNVCAPYNFGGYGFNSFNGGNYGNRCGGCC